MRGSTLHCLEVCTLQKVEDHRPKQDFQAYLQLNSHITYQVPTHTFQNISEPN